MGFRNVRDYVRAFDEGRTYTSHFRKSFANATAGWIDCSVTGGGPPANYYASVPLEAATFNGSRGIYIGDDKSPSTRYLTHFGAATTTATSRAQVMLCDYLLYYPFVDCEAVSQQDLINDVQLTRYTDGEGVMVMPVCVASTTPSGGAFTFEYVNQDGNVKTSPTQSCSPLGITMNVGCCIGGLAGATTGFGAFCPLSAGDRGVRRINSVTFSSVNGGLMALVLVKVLADIGLREGGTFSEKEFVSRSPGAPRIYDGAYLNLVQYCPQAPTSTQMSGYIKLVWDEGV